MASVELDEGEYNTLVAALKLLETLNGSRETRSLLTKAIKVHFPQTTTDEEVAAEVAKPYIEKVESTAAALQERLDAIDAREKALADKQATDAFDSAFNRLRSQHGYNDDGIDKVKRLMVDRNIPDPEAAAALFEKLNPPPPVIARSSWEKDRWDLDTDAVDVDVKGLFANPDKWEDEAIGRILVEERSKAA